MEDRAIKPALPPRQSAMPELLREVALVGIAGALFALAANEISPRGLRLTRNYFPGTPPIPAAATAGATPKTDAGLAPASPVRELADQLKAQGLQVVDGKTAAQLFRDPRCAQEGIVFIDARDDRHYQAGHIPGAYQFDHYHAENYFATVLPVCLAAEQIVVYCTGGSCEDSKYTALTLGDAGVPKEKLFVFAGGITEWIASGLPVELDRRKSGKLQPAKP